MGEGCIGKVQCFGRFCFLLCTIFNFQTIVFPASSNTWCSINQQAEDKINERSNEEALYKTTIKDITLKSGKLLFDEAYFKEMMEKIAGCPKTQLLVQPARMNLGQYSVDRKIQGQIFWPTDRKNEY